MNRFEADEVHEDSASRLSRELSEAFLKRDGGCERTELSANQRAFELAAELQPFDFLALR